MKAAARWMVLLGTVLAMAGGLLAPTPAGAAPTTVTFAYTGAMRQFTVPAGVESIDVMACGARGGAGSGVGGLGGRARRSIDVTPGETLAIFVGGSGDNSGWNGGGLGAGLGGNGGGASDVRQGGEELTDRVVVGGGGGGGGIGFILGQPPQVTVGGAGGGLTGGDGTIQTTGGTQTAGGAPNGSLGVGGDTTSPNGGAGGGGGLYGGGGGWRYLTDGIDAHFSGGGGSGLGTTFGAIPCSGNGVVTLTYDTAPVITPFGALLFEGNSGSTFMQVPVFLSKPSPVPVTIEWATVDGQTGSGLATSGSDFSAASGTVTFDPGETTEYVAIELLGDTTDEPALLWGEWGLISFTNPTNATLDTATFFGQGLFIIVDDD